MRNLRLLGIDCSNTERDEKRDGYEKDAFHTAMYVLKNKNTTIRFIP